MKQLNDPVIYLEEDDFNTNLQIPALQGLSILMVQGDYCGYCTQMKPMFQELANNLGRQGINFVTIQVDSQYPSEQIFKSPEFVNGFLQTSLPGVPYMVKLYDGQVLPNSQFEGDRNIKSIHEWILS